MLLVKELLGHFVYMALVTQYLLCFVLVSLSLFLKETKKIVIAFDLAQAFESVWYSSTRRKMRSTTERKKEKKNEIKTFCILFQLIGKLRKFDDVATTCPNWQRRRVAYPLFNESLKLFLKL